MDAIEQLTRDLERFAKERDWEQFHCPKNLAIALSVESSELLEHFQWLETGDSEAHRLPKSTREEVELEMADVFLYLLRLADRMNVNLVDAAKRKLQINSEKYPVSLARGNAIKYSRRTTDGSDD
jgi:dCTP diphosphatase